MSKIFPLLYLLLCMALVGCSNVAFSSDVHDAHGAGAEANESATQTDGESTHHESTVSEHGETGSHHQARLPNQGASIRIVEPKAGETHPMGEEIAIEVEVEKFTLGEEGKHWHIFVDDVAYGMIMGANTDSVLIGLQPGVHEVAVYLSMGTHQDLEEGDTVQITVGEAE